MSESDLIDSDLVDSVSTDPGLLDIAVRAANLAERQRVLAAVTDPGLIEPSAVERWQIGRHADRISAKTGLDRDEAVRLLTAYHAVTMNPDRLGDAGAAVVRDLHRDWFPTYQRAMTAWRAPDPNTDREPLALVTRPFLDELRRGLVDLVVDPVHPGVLDNLCDHLRDRFELLVAWAVEADAKVHCARTGTDPHTAGEAEYDAYLTATFGDRAAHHRFFVDFPVLGRWLAHITALVISHGRELLTRLVADQEALSSGFFPTGGPIREFRAITPGTGDFHAGGRSVVRVEVSLADHTTGSFYYKPRSLGSETALQRLLARLADDGVVDFATRPILDRGAYGYEAAIPGGRNHVGRRSEVVRIYEELGGYLAVFYILGGGDLHFENILVADGHAFVCDCETVLGVIPRGRRQSTDTLLDSVFKTGLLEWPRPSGDDPDAMRISGYAGGEGYDVPMAVPRIQRDRGGFAASVEYEENVHIVPGAGNRVFLDGRIVGPQEFVPDIIAGFERVYDWFAADPAGTGAFISEIFTGSTPRFINWGTQVYGQLMASARHPKCLADPIEVDLLTASVRTLPRTWDIEGLLADREIEALWRLDVPIFSADAHGLRLRSDHVRAVDSPLEVSPVDNALTRVHRLTPENRNTQVRYIAASLSSERIRDADFIRTSVDHAVAVGRFLVSRQLSGPSPWTTFGMVAGESMEMDIETDLYAGSAGVAWFLAYLDEIAPDPDFRATARRAARHALDEDPGERIGGFTGTGGLLYLMTHLYHLWGEREWLDEAVRLRDGLADRIEDDRHFDVLHGVAGLIPVLLGLEDVLGDGRGLALAHRCARHLLRHARPTGDTLSWASVDPTDCVADLTGLSHGAGGIGWALVLLGARTGVGEYTAAARRAFAYEALHYDDEEHDWYDLRTVPGGVRRRNRHFANAWCNGAPGIGLTRIASWAALGRTDETLLREAHQALSATLRRFSRLKNHTLCHGTSGNAELLFRFGELNSEPAFQLEANVQAQLLWRSLDAMTGEDVDQFFPGLLIGMSGFGAHLLRLAHPERVPSVLLLDPPLEKE